jgi:tellurite resistance protein
MKNDSQNYTKNDSPEARQNLIRTALMPTLMIQRSNGMQAHPAVERVVAARWYTLQKEFESSNRALPITPNELNAAIAEPLSFLIPEARGDRERALFWAVLAAIADGTVTSGEAQLLLDLNGKLGFNSTETAEICACAFQALRELSIQIDERAVAEQLQRELVNAPVKHLRTKQKFIVASQIAMSDGQLLECERATLHRMLVEDGVDDVEAFRILEQCVGMIEPPSDPGACWSCVSAGIQLACSDGEVDARELKLVLDYARSWRVDDELLAFTLQAAALSASAQLQKDVLTSLREAVAKLRSGDYRADDGR